MRPRRVTYILDTDEIGGVEVHLLTLLRHIDRQGFRPSVILPPNTRGKRVCELLEELDVPITLHAMPHGRWDARTLSSLRRVIRRSRPDVTHAHLRWTWDNPYAVVAARLAMSPVVVSTEHSTSSPEVFGTSRSRMFKRFLVKLQDRVIVPCDHVGNRLIENARVPARKFVTIRHGIEIPDEPRERSQGGIRRDLDIDFGTPLIGMVARMEPRTKRFDDFLKAARRISREVPAAHFVLVGEGPPPHRLALQQLAGELALAHRVHFLGFRADAPRIISELDVLVMVSDNEACLPIVALEAMARHTPVVATSLGGAREQMTHGETGFLVPPRDIGAISECVLAVLRDPSLAQRVSQRARQVVGRYFNVRAMADETQALYLRLLTHPRLPDTDAKESLAEVS